RRRRRGWSAAPRPEPRRSGSRVRTRPAHVGDRGIGADGRLPRCQTARLRRGRERSDPRRARPAWRRRSRRPSALRRHLDDRGVTPEPPWRVVIFSMVLPAALGLDALTRAAGHETVALLAPRLPEDAAEDQRERWHELVNGVPDHL